MCPRGTFCACLTTRGNVLDKPGSGCSLETGLDLDVADLDGLAYSRCSAYSKPSDASKKERAEDDFALNRPRPARAAEVISAVNRSFESAGVTNLKARASGANDESWSRNLGSLTSRQFAKPYSLQDGRLTPLSMKHPQEHFEDWDSGWFEEPRHLRSTAIEWKEAPSASLAQPRLDHARWEPEQACGTPGMMVAAPRKGDALPSSLFNSLFQGL